ncbi:hypothetical protein CEF21_07065 [Bacillus sp. FJAT-42376]|nr:hypothetical protein CEF21_07065 [Bacillus sp. FJAT-42376]
MGDALFHFVARRKGHLVSGKNGLFYRIDRSLQLLQMNRCQILFLICINGGTVQSFLDTCIMQIYYLQSANI